VKEAEERIAQGILALHLDSRDAVTFMTVLHIVNFRLFNDPQLRDKIGFYLDFWNSVRSSLLSSGVSAIGRLYDTHSASHGIGRLLEDVETYRGLFTREAFLERKARQGTAPELLRSVEESARDVDMRALEPIKAEFKECVSI
jgi:hypothetical protein